MALDAPSAPRPSPPEPARVPGLLARAFDSDLWFSFTRSPVVIVAALVTLMYFLAALFAPWVAPQNPFDPAQLSLIDSFTAPAWTEGGMPQYLLGTDDQGRDILSNLIYGARISLLVGFAAVLFSATLGILLGVTAGYVGGGFESIVMRTADVQLTVPGILVALMIDGVARATMPRELHDQIAHLRGDPRRSASPTGRNTPG